MTAFQEISHDDQVVALSALASEVSSLYFDEVTSIELVNYEFNATYKVVSRGFAYAMRINVNSTRSLENLHAEVAFVNFLSKESTIRVPRLCKSRGGESVLSAKMHGLEKAVHVVMYSWLEGVEVGDEPNEEQLFALGRSMAQMHNVVQSFSLPDGTSLPKFDEFFWRTKDFLFSSHSKLQVEQREILFHAKNGIDEIVAKLYQDDRRIVIHADLHGWNLMWDKGSLGIFDFDDSGIGLPVQDLATALYYLDTPEQDKAVLDGYRSVRAVPEYSESEMQALLLQRRILLLNYIYETSNKEHQALLPEYLPETLRRAQVFLASHK